jgi:hypothetical protein
LPPPTVTVGSTRNTTHQLALQLALSQCEPPLMQWLRPSGLTTVNNVARKRTISCSCIA